jgi:hypothetical protein
VCASLRRSVFAVVPVVALPLFVLCRFAPRVVIPPFKTAASLAGAAVRTEVSGVEFGLGLGLGVALGGVRFGVTTGPLRFGPTLVLLRPRDCVPQVWVCSGTGACGCVVDFACFPCFSPVPSVASRSACCCRLLTAAALTVSLLADFGVDAK